MKKCLLLAAILFSTNISFSYPLVPDPHQTPGEMCDENDKDYAEKRYPERIDYCARKVSSSFKRRIYDNYEIPLKERRRYTIDHFIPLSIGGDNSSDNLWPEHKDVKALRPDLEFNVYEELKIGNITQKEAVKIIVRAKMNPHDDPIEFLRLENHFENFKAVFLPDHRLSR